jgi:hypothetical protein
MARLGELLLQVGLLTSDQLAAGLRAQVKYGGRLGSNLLELGVIDLDTIARTLGIQHGLPAALAKHFDELDPELQARLSAGLAARFECIPLRHVFGARHGVVLAASAPLAADQLAEIADELFVPREHLITAIAAEMRIKYFLERVYRITRPPRFLRVRGSIPPAMDERRAYLEHRAELALVNATRLARGSRANLPMLRDGSPHMPQPRPEDAIPAAALDEIRAVTNRDRLATRVLETLAENAHGIAAGMMLLVREDTAIGWRSFSRSPVPVAYAIVPLQFASAIARAVTSQTTVHVKDGAEAVDVMLLRALGSEDHELVVVPIVSDGQVWTVLACAVAPGASALAIERCAEAAGDAVKRMLHAVSEYTSDELAGLDRA